MKTSKRHKDNLANYNKDTCAQDEIEMFVMKEYGCTPPIFEK